METIGVINEEIDALDSGKVYHNGEGVQAVNLIEAEAQEENWVYRVDKSTNNWVLKVQFRSTVMLHTSPLFYPCVEYDLLPNTQQLIIYPGQWCEMIYNGAWSLMTDADHR